MADRTDFIDQLYNRGYFSGEVVGTYGSSTSTYLYWRNFAQYLDDSELGFPGGAQAIVDEAERHWKDGRISDYYAYSAIYRMMTGSTYRIQEPDEPVTYISNEDKDVEIAYWNSEPYTGDEWFQIDAITPELPNLGTSLAIVTAIRAVFARYPDATLMTVYIKTTQKRMASGLTIAASHAVRITFHGSPIPQAVLAGILAVLVLAMGFTLYTFMQTTSRIVEETNQTDRKKLDNEMTQASLNSAAANRKLAADPNAPYTPEQRGKLNADAAALEASAGRTAEESAKRQGAPPPDPTKKNPLSEISDLVKWGIVGLGVVMILPLVTEAVRSSRRTA